MVGLVVKVTVVSVGGPRFCLRGSQTSDLKIWHFAGYPARHLVRFDRCCKSGWSGVSILGIKNLTFW